MARRELSSLLSKFSNETIRIETLFTSVAFPHGTVGTAWTDAEAVHCHCVLRLHDSWARFCRHTVFTCAIGSALTSSGNYIARSAVLNQGEHPEKALRRLSPQWKTRQHRWHATDQAVRAAQDLQDANLPTLSGALLAQNNYIKEVTVVRNFLAHRSLQTATHPEMAALRARWTFPSTSFRPNELPRCYLPGGVLLFSQWCTELRKLATAATL